MSKKRICLDAGHYGSQYNAGAVTGYYESAIVWKLTMMEKDILEKMGVEVVLTRQNINDNPELTERGKMAKGCDLFVSNHTNACGTPSVNRASVIFLVDRKETDIDEKSAEFANQLAKVVQTTMGVNGFNVYSKLSDSDRDKNGIKDDNYYGILHGGFLAGVPSVISEHSFHTNEQTCKWLMDDNNLRKLAEACATCMAKFIGVPDTDSTPEIPSASNNVKVGDVVSINPESTYYNGKDIPDWVEKKQWIVASVKGDRVVIDKSVDGKSSINSPINAANITVVNGKEAETNTPENLPTPVKPATPHTIKVGDVVSIAAGATYYNGKDIPDWVEKKQWIVKSVNGDRAVIDKSVDGKSSIESPINVKYLSTSTVKAKENTTKFTPYLVEVSIQKLNIRKGPGTNYSPTGKYTGAGTFTIIEEQKGPGSSKGWGKLKSEAGWISLDYATRI